MEESKIDIKGTTIKRLNEKASRGRFDTPLFSSSFSKDIQIGLLNDVGSRDRRSRNYGNSAHANSDTRFRWNSRDRQIGKRWKLETAWM